MDEGAVDPEAPACVVEGRRRPLLPPHAAGRYGLGRARNAERRLRPCDGASGRRRQLCRRLAAKSVVATQGRWQPRRRRLRRSVGLGGGAPFPRRSGSLHVRLAALGREDHVAAVDEAELAHADEALVREELGNPGVPECRLAKLHLVLGPEDAFDVRQRHCPPPLLHQMAEYPHDRVPTRHWRFVAGRRGAQLLGACCLGH
mmetsp:Transcript_126943/g.365122  ORF Transcript_126943/g.365122 Transcript_126943/m.365122 type:complete len:202 (-) Transcript_126943:678-1283(-)